MGASLLLFGCSQERRDVFQGYVEGEYVHVAAPVGGALQRLAVQRGQQVHTGDLLYELDPEPERAAVQQAEQRVAQAEARLADLTKGLRPSEIAALEARLASAKATATLAASELDRFGRLSAEQVISPDEMDRARTRRDAAQAQVASLEAELETARLGGRESQIDASRAEVTSVRAALDQSRWALAQKSQMAPTNGVIHDTLYREGEWVAAGRPVVSLLPPANRKVRFFVPQERVPDCQPGGAVSVRLDGVTDEVAGTISYVSTEAEFTPPVIYSRENRAKLVFMIEAVFRPEDATRLSPGQPADVRLTH